MLKYLVVLSDKYGVDYEKFENYQEALEFFQEHKDKRKYAYLTEITRESHVIE